jgi:hypothetical protein
MWIDNHELVNVPVKVSSLLDKNIDVKIGSNFKINDDIINLATQSETISIKL